MGKSEEIRVVISADAKQLGRELTAAERAVMKAKGIYQSAGGSIEASSKSWAKYRTTAVSEMNKAVEGVKKAQAKVAQIRAQIQASTMSDNDVEPYIRAALSMNRSDAEIQAMVEEMQRPSPELERQFETATAELDKYKKAAQEAGESVDYLNKKVEESAGAESAQAQAAQAATARAREQARAARESASVQRESAKSTSGGLMRFARTAVLAVIGVRTLYAGLRKLVSALLETAKADSSLKTSLGQIKGNMSVAFQSIYQAALPALRALASTLATVTNYLTQFMSMLFGVSWGTAAKGAQDYASAVSGAGGAAKAAASNMMSLDELNVMQSDSAGGGGSSGGIAPIYQEMQRPQWLTDIVEWLRPVQEAFQGLWGAIKDFVDGVKEKVTASPTQAFTDLRDAIVDVIKVLGDLLKNEAFQTLVAGIINIAVLTVASALSIAAKFIGVIVSLLSGDGRGALGSFLGMAIEAVSWLKNVGLEVKYALVTASQSIALAAATARGDMSAVERITQDMSNAKKDYELQIMINEDSKKNAEDFLDRLLGTSKSTSDATADAKGKIAEYDEQLKTANQSATELAKNTAEQVQASTDAISKALAETPTVEAAKKLGNDLMQEFAAGIAEGSGAVMNEITKAVSASGSGIVGAAKKIAEDSKTPVMNVVKDLVKGIQKQFYDLFERIHFDFAYMLGGVAADVRLMVDQINKAFERITTTININVVVHFSTTGDIGGSIPVDLPLSITKTMARGGIIHAAAAGGGFSTGQLFIAREAGPELVAGIGGGKTAVMNNNQIVESVSIGVYRAVVDAMLATQSDEKGDFVVNVDGREWLRIQRRAERSSGYQMTNNPVFT